MLGAAFTVSAAGMLVAVLAATPVHDNRTVLIRQADLAGPPGALRILADQAEVMVSWHPETKTAARILVKGRGFGLPGTRVVNTLEHSGADATLEINHQGVFTERDTSITLFANPRGLVADRDRHRGRGHPRRSGARGRTRVDARDRRGQGAAR